MHIRTVILAAGAGAIMLYGIFNLKLTVSLVYLSFLSFFLILFQFYGLHIKQDDVKQISCISQEKEEINSQSIALSSVSHDSSYESDPPPSSSIENIENIIENDKSEKENHTSVEQNSIKNTTQIQNTINDTSDITPKIATPVSKETVSLSLIKEKEDVQILTPIKKKRNKQITAILSSSASAKSVSPSKTLQSPLKTIVKKEGKKSSKSPVKKVDKDETSMTSAANSILSSLDTTPSTDSSRMLTNQEKNDIARLLNQKRSPLLPTPSFPAFPSSVYQGPTKSTVPLLEIPPPMYEQREEALPTPVTPFVPLMTKELIQVLTLAALEHLISLFSQFGIVSMIDAHNVSDFFLTSYISMTFQEIKRFRYYIQVYEEKEFFKIQQQKQQALMEEEKKIALKNLSAYTYKPSYTKPIAIPNESQYAEKKNHSSWLNNSPGHPLTQLELDTFDLALNMFENVLEF